MTWSQFTSGPPILEAINAGSLDFGAVGNAPPVFAAAAGAKIAIVRSRRRESAARPSRPGGLAHQTPADLRGKRVAVAKGSSSNFHLLAVLKKEGLSFEDMPQLYLQPPDAHAALSSPQDDAWAMRTPCIKQAEQQDHAGALVVGRGLGQRLRVRDRLKRHPGRSGPGGGARAST